MPQDALWVFLDSGRLEFDEKASLKARTLLGESLRKQAVEAVGKSIDLLSFKIAEALYFVISGSKPQPKEKLEALKVLLNCELPQMRREW